MSKYVRKTMDVIPKLGHNYAYTVAQHNGYSGLANAVVIQALSDYSEAMVRIVTKKFTVSQNDFSEIQCRRMVDEVHAFMLSQYFGSLTDLDGQYLLDLVDDKLCKKLEVTKHELHLQRSV